MRSSGSGPAVGVGATLSLRVFWQAAVHDQEHVVDDVFEGRVGDPEASQDPPDEAGVDAIDLGEAGRGRACERETRGLAGAGLGGRGRAHRG